MTAPRRYASAKALDSAIKARAVAEAKTGRYDVNQIRRHFAFGRFLTRLFLDPGSRWVLKGGTGLLARVPQHARHTQDIDLYRHGEIDQAESELATAATVELDDYFSFDLEQIGVLSGSTSGRRYKVLAYLGDTKFADFQIDAVVDSNMTSTPDHAPGLRPIDIDGLTTCDYRIYPVVDHLADKLVAMTSRFAGERPSTRYRDLVDIVLMAQTQSIEASALCTAVESELLHRSHGLPERLELPDDAWISGYAGVARTVATLDVQIADDALKIASALYAPVFDSSVGGVWQPSTLKWV